jgi:hypothetical protein
MNQLDFLHAVVVVVEQVVPGKAMIGPQGPLVFRWTAGSRHAQLQPESENRIILFLWDDAGENVRTKTGYPTYLSQEERWVGVAGSDIIAWLRGD